MLKAKIKVSFSRSYCCYGNPLYKKMTTTCLPMIENLYDTIIIASLVKVSPLRRVLQLISHYMYFSMLHCKVCWEVGY